jgi:hypothetical protein
MNQPTAYLIKDPAAPATEPQINYLNSLLAARPTDCVPAKRAQFVITANLLTKGVVSELIDQLKAVPVIAAPTPPFGYYLVPVEGLDDAIYYFDKTKKDYTPRLRRLRVKKNYAGKILGGRWTVVGGTVQAAKILAGIAPLTETETGKLGKQFGFCVRCGRLLTDPVSVANGIGPVCAKYWA